MPIATCFFDSDLTCVYCSPDQTCLGKTIVGIVQGFCDTSKTKTMTVCLCTGPSTTAHNTTSVLADANDVTLRQDNSKLCTGLSTT